jgi:polyisoprenoid-binding protein YceI
MYRSTSRVLAVVTVASVSLVSLVWLSTTRISRVAALRAFQGRTLSIVPSESKVWVAVGKAGLLSTLGHDHTINARTFSGKVQLAGNDAKNGSIQVEFDAASLRVADQGISEPDRSEIQKTMETEVLDVSRFPKITFKSTATRGDGQNVSVEGDLTLHGVTKKITVPVEVSLAGDRLRATGKVAFKQTDFGIKPYSKGGGSIKVKDEVVLNFQIAAR